MCKTFSEGEQYTVVRILFCQLCYPYRVIWKLEVSHEPVTVVKHGGCLGKASPGTSARPVDHRVVPAPWTLYHLSHQNLSSSPPRQATAQFSRDFDHLSSTLYTLFPSFSVSRQSAPCQRESKQSSLSLCWLSSSPTPKL